MVFVQEGLIPQQNRCLWTRASCQPVHNRIAFRFLFTDDPKKIVSFENITLA